MVQGVGSLRNVASRAPPGVAAPGKAAGFQHSAKQNNAVFEWSGRMGLPGNCFCNAQTDASPIGPKSCVLRSLRTAIRRGSGSMRI